MSGERFYDLAIRLIAGLFVLIGTAILVLTIVNGGGPISTGFLIGAAFIGIGVARYVIQTRVVRADEDSR